ncbi:MAG: hypothetical protein KAQ98_04880 [Bacteriovoracaceae bacterium]|nr:hypothetical protein [Bacteriovoracaceae bacterium]
MKFSKAMKFLLINVLILCLVKGVLATGPVQDQIPSGSTREIKTAYEAYKMLRRSHHTKEPIGLEVRNATKEINRGLVSYGAEKEGSSSRITKVMGPTVQTLDLSLKKLSEEERKAFLSEFMDRVKRGKGVVSSVRKLDGTTITVDRSKFQNIDFFSLDLNKLEQHFNAWTDQTEDNPFSFMSRKLRQDIHGGNVSGLSPPFTESITDFDNVKWVPLFGDAERFIEACHSLDTITGWEINFKPQYSYGEFEEMIDWFRKIMGTNGNLFQSPGHQRIVFTTPELAEKSDKIFKRKMAHMYKLTQAYIILRGLSGNTGINLSRYKEVQYDRYIETLDTGRGSIRLENDYIMDGTRSIELRAGTKDPVVSSFIHQMISSRVATQDFSGITFSDKWTLIPEEMIETSDKNIGIWELNKNIGKRFDVEDDIVNQCTKNIKEIRKSYYSLGSSNSISIEMGYWAPFWQWDEAPFLSDGKKKLLKKATKSFIETMAKLESPNEDNVKRLFQDWARVSELDRDIENYLRPKKASTGKQPDIFKIPDTMNRKFDVNKIDMGIEYSAHFPMDNKSIMTNELSDHKRAWLVSTFDLTNDERADVMKELAEKMAKNLGVKNPEVKMIEASNEHGHKLDLAFEFKDAKDRKWRIEWDGIGRSYTKTGELVSESPRGGHIEIVTPKFNPNFNEIKSVYEALNESSVVPYFKLGGSHINVDLKPFMESDPKSLARVTSLFLQYRGLLSLMYQHPNRFMAAEPLKISSNLAAQLANFNGTHDDLKKLLFNERYFNTRIGRKSRYTQLDLSSYYQDIIPEEFITEDFDIKNPKVQWRRQFRVDPDIRKMEFRLFGAPEDAYESALQLKLVRAILNKAMNDDTPLTGVVSKYSYEDYLNNPKLAYKHLDEMCDDLHLPKDQYDMAVSRGLSQSKFTINSNSYKPVSYKKSLHPEIEGWGKALDRSRPKAEEIKSEGRKANISENVEEPIARWDKKRLDAISRADELRSNVSVNDLKKSGHIIRNTKEASDAGCASIIANFF